MSIVNSVMMHEAALTRKSLSNSVGQSVKHAKLIMHIPFENKWISPSNIKCDHTLRVLFKSTMAMPHFRGVHIGNFLICLEVLDSY